MLCLTRYDGQQVGIVTVLPSAFIVFNSHLIPRCTSGFIIVGVYCLMQSVSGFLCVRYGGLMTTRHNASVPSSNANIWIDDKAGHISKLNIARCIAGLVHAFYLFLYCCLIHYNA